MVAAVVGGLGYGVYHETRPHRIVRYYSTDYLLERELQSPKFFLYGARYDEDLYDELLRRAQSRQLTQAHFDDWLRLYTEEYAPQIDIPSPYPVGFRLELAGKLRRCNWLLGSPGFQAPFPGYWVYTHVKDELLINGKLIAATDFNKDVSPTTLLVEMGIYEDPRIAIGHAHTLKTGTHQIEIRRTIRFEEREESKAANSWEAHYLPTTITYTSRKEVEVVKQDAASLTKGIYDECDVDILKTKMEFKNYSSIREYDRRRSLNFPVVAGYCLIYPTTSRDAETEACVYRIPQDNCRVAEIIVDCIADANGGQAIFVPDADLAFDAGHDWYFYGVIEWHNIKIKNGMPLFGTPDVIRPYN